MRHRALSIAVATVFALGAANASTLAPVQTNGATFTDLAIGTITVGALSSLVGSVFAVDSLTATVPFVGTVTFALQAVSFSGAGAGALTPDLDPSAAGFSFANVAPGSYLVKATGALSGPAAVSGVAFIGANYTLSPVPEPGTYAMLLAGLAAVGFVAKRRAANT